MPHQQTTITVAAATFPPERRGSLAAWHAKIERWLTQARDRGAQLAVFPEYAGMELASLASDGAEGDVQSALSAVSGRLAQADDIHKQLAARLGLHIVAGSAPWQGPDGRYRNVARLITPAGRIGTQAKLMLTPWERTWGMAAGTTPIVFDTDIGRVAIAICYDSEFPLNVRAQAEAGADIIVIPACTDALTGYSRVRTAALARALENQCATVLSPLSGAAPWCPVIDENVGTAGIYGPADRGISDTGVLAEGQRGETGWTIARIDLAAIRDSRSTGQIRTFAHWAEQAGARSLAANAQAVDLR